MLAISANLNLCDDAGLFTLLAADDEKGFKFIYNKHHERIYRIAMGYLKSDAVAEEVVQEVFMKLWFERNNIKPGTPIQGWLCTVAKNNTINRLKKMASESKAINYLKVTQAQHGNCAQDKLKDADCNQLLGKALNNLSDNQRKVFRLAREENQSYIQIANHLNISPLTVKTHMSRAMLNLKTFFKGYLEAV